MAHDVRQNKLTIPEKRPWLSSTVAFEGSGEAKAIARMAQRHIASRVRRDMTCQEACQEARGGMGAREERGGGGWVGLGCSWGVGAGRNDDLVVILYLR
jgi:hypothetical protein